MRSFKRVLAVVMVAALLGNIAPDMAFAEGEPVVPFINVNETGGSSVSPGDSTTSPDTVSGADTGVSPSPSVSPSPTTDADPTSSADPTTSADPTSSADPTTSADPTSSADPTTSADPASSADPTTSPDPTVSPSPFPIIPFLLGSNDQEDGIMPTAVQMLESTSTTLTIYWNDNNDQAKLRPAVTNPSSYDAFYQYFTLYYQTHEGENVNWNTTDGWSQSQEVTLAVLRGMGWSGSALPTASLTEDAQDSGLWHLGLTDIPGVYTDDNTSYTVRYSIEAKTLAQDASFAPNYRLDRTANVFANGSYNTEMYYTVLTDFEAYVQWLDNSNAVSLRPGITGFVGGNGLQLYRYQAGQNPTEATVVSNALSLTEENGSDIWTLSAKGQPVYDIDGHPYTYYAAYPDVDDDQSYAVGEDGDQYVFAYQNVTEYAADESYLHEGGTMVNTLTNETDFMVHKKWIDGNNANRPDATLYLYRVAEVMVDGKPAFNPDEGSPVPHFDSQIVPKVDGEIIFVSSTGDTTERMPLYDANGRRYVYYAIERGLTGDYVKEISNPTGSATSTQGDGDTYLLNGGTITNKLEREITIPITKIFHAKAMQSLSTTNTTVTMQLQMQTGIDETSQEPIWTPVEGAEVIMDAGSFRAESMTHTVNEIKVAKYDSDSGAELHYRWVETSLTVNGTTYDAPEGEGLVMGTTITLGTTKEEDVAPGVNGVLTTAQFTPTYADDDPTGNTIINTLTGYTQLNVVKRWISSGTNVSSGTVTNFDFGGVTVTVDVLQDGVKYGDSVTLTVDNYNATTGGWTKLLDTLPRYDAQGDEYEYTVDETSVTGLPEGWTLDDIQYQIAVVEDEIEDTTLRVPRTEVTITNVQGPGTHLIFDVEKQWLDDNDLLSRKQVTVGVFHKDNLTTPVAFGTADLNEQNLWRARITISKANDSDSTDNYIVKEISAGTVNVAYSEETFDGLRAKSDELTGIAGITANPTPGVLVGELAETSTGKALDYRYHVYLGRTKVVEGKHDRYTIYNQRHATLDLDFTKTWVMGDKIEVPSATFQLMRGVAGQVSREYGEPFVLQPENTGYYTAHYLFSAAQTADRDALDKYDHLGRMYTYTIVETKMGGETISPNGTVSVDGDTYVSSLQQEKVVYGADHHDHDVYYWTGTNTRQETFELIINKVWQDDGSNVSGQTARPDVVFSLYRTTSTMDRVLAVTSAADAVAIGERVSCDRIWNTRLNDWLWQCNFGSVPRYDSEGNPYIYYLLENTNANAGDYEVAYYNGTEIPKATGTPASTEDVFAPSAADGAEGYGTVLVITDEYGSAASTSKTVVNYRKRDLTISGNKIWGLPRGLSLSLGEMPDVKLTLARVHAVSFIEEEEPEQITTFHLPDEADRNSTIAWAFQYDTQPYYDNYGRKYDYFLAEEPVNGYPNPTIPLNGFVVRNEYTPTAPYVEIPVTKVWDNQLTDVGEEALKLGTTTIELHAVCGTSDVVVATHTFRAADVYADAQDNHSETYTFTEYNVSGSQFYGTKLPYYAPDGQPYGYYLKEIVDDGYTGEVTSGTNNIITRLAPYLRNLLGARNVGSDKVLRTDTLVFDTTGQNANKAYELAANQLVPTFTNTYTGVNDAAINLSIEKQWTDVFSATVRPSAITVTIGRKTSGGIEDTKWSKDISLSSETGTSNIAACWNNTLADVMPYAPDGQPWVYYVVRETATDTDANRLNSYTTDLTNQTFRPAQEDATTGTAQLVFGNTLPTTTIGFYKTWVLDGVMTEQTGNQRTPTAQELMRAAELGALPKTITFKLQVKVRDDWVEKLDDVSLVESALTYDLTKEADCETLLKSSAVSPIYFTHAVMDGDATKNQHYPKYQQGVNGIDSVGSLMEYRVVEELVWGEEDSTEVTSTSTYTTNGLVCSVDATSTGTESAQLYGVTNKLTVRPLRITKDWEDNNNQEGARPDQVTFNLFMTDGSETAISLGYGDHVDENQNRYSTGILYVPRYTKDGVESIYRVTEEEITNYTMQSGDPAQSKTSDDPVMSATNYNDFTFTNTYDMLHSRATITITAKKEWKEDSTYQWLSRPSAVYLTLQYRLNDWAAGRWEDADTGADACGLSEDATKRVITGGNAEWQCSWSGLYRYQTGGIGGAEAREIEYRVVERYDENGTELQGYTASYNTTTDGNGDKTFTVTNTMKTFDQQVPLYKKWTMVNADDTTNEALDSLYSAWETTGDAPKRLMFKIQYRVAGSGDAFQDLKDADNQLVTQIENVSGFAPVTYDLDTELKLPVSNTLNQKLEYQLLEYQVSYEETGTNWKAINETSMSVNHAYVQPADTNQWGAENTLTTGSFTVHKVWEDHNDRDGKRIAPTYQLYRVDSEGKTIKIGDAVTTNQTSYTWKNLPVYEPLQVNGELVAYQYYVEENAITDYSTTYKTGTTESTALYGDDPTTAKQALTGSPAAAAVTVRNTYSPITFTVQVDKTWEDGDNAYGLRPDSVALELQYRLQEGDVWKPVGTHTDSLSNDGTTVSSKQSAQQVSNASASWPAVTWEELPAYARDASGSYLVQYRVVEVDNPGYTVSMKNADGTGENITSFQCDITGNKNRSFTLTNTAPQSVQVQKTWEATEDTFLPQSVQVQLQYHDGDDDWRDIGDIANLTNPSWNHTFSSLPDNYDYQVVERSITYSDPVGKVDVNTTTNRVGTFGITVTKESDHKFHITNTFEATTHTVLKTWDDEADRDGKRTSITLQLKKDGNAYGAPVTLDKSTPGVIVTGNLWRYTWGNLPRYQNDGTTACLYTVEETVVTTDYTRDEDAAEKDADGHSTITNIHEVARLTITASKKWVDSENVNDTRPAEEMVTYTLQYKKGNEWLTVPATHDGSGVTPYLIEGTATVTTTGDAKWVVPSLGGATAIQYRVQEQKVASYEAAYSQTTVSSTTAAEQSIIITNTLQETSLDVTKQWQGDSENAFSTRPESVTVKLQRSADGGSTWTDVAKPSPLTLTAANDWKGSFTHLPKYADADNSVTYQYRAVETQMQFGPTTKIPVAYQDDDPAKGGTAGAYTVQCEGGTVTNTLQTTRLTASKVWANDQDNYYATRPTTDLQVQLQRRIQGSGTGVLYNVIAFFTGQDAQDTGWENVQYNDKDWAESLVYDTDTQTWQSVTFAALPAADTDGTKYEYRAVEVTLVPGYQSTATYETADQTATITNTLETMNVRITKVWEDQSNHYGTRPQTLALEVWNQSGRLPIQPVIQLVEAVGDEWTYQITGLPKHIPGTEEEAVYSIRETVPIGYETEAATVPVQAGEAVLTNELLTTTHTVHPIWQDAEDRDGVRPDEILVQLYREGSSATDLIPINDPVTLTETGGWDYTWQGLPQTVPGTIDPAVYTVREGAMDNSGTFIPYIPGENADIGNDYRLKEITESADGITTNICNIRDYAMFNIKATKQWSDLDNQYGLRPDDIALRLEYSTDGSTWQTVSQGDWHSCVDDPGDTVTTFSAIEQTLTGDARANVWEQAQWLNLPGYVRAEGVSVIVQYRVVEVSMGTQAVTSSYTSTPSGNLTIHVAFHPEAGELPDGGSFPHPIAPTQANAVVLNALLAENRTQVTVTQTWDEASIRHAALPASVRVQLQYRSGILGQWQDVPDNGTADLTADNNAWTHTFTDLRGDYQYRVVARSMTGADGIVYFFAADGDAEHGTLGGFTGEADTEKTGDVYRATLHNALMTRDLSGTLTWRDYSDQHGARPTAARFSFRYSDGSELAVQPEVTWTKNGNTWQWQAKGLPQYLPGTTTPAVYTVTEESVAQYTIQRTSINSDTALDFVDELVMPALSITITKHSGSQNGATLAGCGYRLARENEDGTTSWYSGLDANGVATWTVDQEAAQIITTDGQGTATVTGLPYGSYYFVEVVAPPGYRLSTEPLRITLNASNQSVDHQVWQAGTRLPAESNNILIDSVPKTGDPSHPAILMTVIAMAVALLALTGKRRIKP